MFSLLLAPAFALVPVDDRSDARCAAIMHAYLGPVTDGDWDDQKVAGLSSMMFFVGKLSATHDGPTIKARVAAQKEAVARLSQAELKPIVDKCRDEMSAIGRATGL